MDDRKIAVPTATKNHAQEAMIFLLKKEISVICEKGILWKNIWLYFLSNVEA